MYMGLAHDGLMDCWLTICILVLGISLFCFCHDSLHDSKNKDTTLKTEINSVLYSFIRTQTFLQGIPTLTTRGSVIAIKAIKYAKLRFAAGSSAVWVCLRSPGSRLALTASYDARNASRFSFIQSCMDTCTLQKTSPSMKVDHVFTNVQNVFWATLI